MGIDNMVSQELLNELKQIILEDYGVNLKPDDVSEIGNNLVNFISLLADINLNHETNATTSTRSSR